MKMTPLRNKVLDLLCDGNWHSTSSLSQQLKTSIGNVTSRIRDLRLPEYGHYRIKTRRIKGNRYEYQLLNPPGKLTDWKPSAGSFIGYGRSGNVTLQGGSGTASGTGGSITITGGTGGSSWNVISNTGTWAVSSVNAEVWGRGAAQTTSQQISVKPGEIYTVNVAPSINIDKTLPW